MTDATAHQKIEPAWEGRQTSVSAAGKAKALTQGAVMGTKDGGAASKAYNDDDGDEQVYFGRG